MYRVVQVYHHHVVNAVAKTTRRISWSCVGLLITYYFPLFVIQKLRCEKLVLCYADC